MTDRLEPSNQAFLFVMHVNNKAPVFMQNPNRQRTTNVSTKNPFRHSKNRQIRTSHRKINSTRPEPEVYRAATAATRAFVA
jgi:hypothetical protein